MDITSIDNCYEDDGLMQASAFFVGLNIEAQQNPTDPKRRVLVAVIPEFRDDGRLDRLNFLTMPAGGPPSTKLSDTVLINVAAGIVIERKRLHDEAIARLEQHPTTVVKPRKK